MCATMAGGRCRACVPRSPGAVGRRSRRGGCRTNCAKGVCLAAAASHSQRAPGRSRGRGQPSAPHRSENPGGSRAIDLVFLDESEALTHPYLARCWARRGVDLRIEAPGQAKKQAMLGAFDPVRQRLLVHTSATKPSPDFSALLDQLGAAYGTAERTRPLVVVLDNGPIHISKLTKALAQ